jgi:prolyl 4-hydroxylase
MESMLLVFKNRLSLASIAVFHAALLLHYRPCLGISTDPEALIGWGGDTFNHGEVFGRNVGSRRWIETLSWHPRAFMFHGFVSPEEADQLIVEAAPHMKRSTVVGEANSVVDNIRTSYGTFLQRLSSPTVELLEKKLANWTQMPIVHQEDVQVCTLPPSSRGESRLLTFSSAVPVQILRYEHMQKYGAHYDALGRVCTVLVYLSTPEEGGETAFPKTTEEDWADPQQRANNGYFSDCAKGHVAAKPQKGDALLFYSLKPDGKTADDLAMHTGCPLLKGIKWTATIWFHPTARSFADDSIAHLSALGSTSSF